MARYDVHPIPGRDGPRRDGRGYVLDVQAKLLDSLKTRIVVPLVLEADAPPPIKDLNPVFELHGKQYVMVTQALAAVPLKELRKAELSLDAHHDKILRALDILLIG